MLKHNGLTLFFALLCLLAIGGQSIAGHADYNEEERAHARLLDEQPQELSYGRYVTSSSFAQDVMENWQSEYLQFLLFMMATTYLIQRGSPESKEPGQEGLESDEEQKVGPHADEEESPWPAKTRGAIHFLYANSLLTLMGLLFAGAWFAQSVTGWTAYNAEQSEHMQSTVSYVTYLGTGDFWNRTLQNWQSEFLAVGSFAIFAVYLRQRGSPESKPVGAPHEATGVEG
ncbi:MAG TPA: DUF6766 family protein [Solirubrobacterales bacterium]|nr:DUF6766 family protein [Solirubrobacterales bacterium]